VQKEDTDIRDYKLILFLRHYTCNVAYQTVFCCGHFGRKTVFKNKKAELMLKIRVTAVCNRSAENNSMHQSRKHETNDDNPLIQGSGSFNVTDFGTNR